MAIVNRGIFDIDTVFQRLVGNDWPSAQVIISGGVGTITAADLTTANIVELVNLYFTNVRAVTAITPILTTANVVEDTNLYFTNARVASNVISLMQSFAGDNITIAANGRISSTASGGAGENPAANLVLMTASVNSFTGDNTTTTFSLYPTPPSKDHMTVVIDGVTQQTSAYSLSGTNLVLTEAPAANSQIDVRYFYGLTSGTFTTRRYVADGVSNTFGITYNLVADSVLVLENGVLQVPVYDYSVSTGNVYFVNTPVANTIIQIRELGAVSVRTTLFANTTTNVAEGANLYFTNARVLTALASSNVTANNLVVQYNANVNNISVINNIAGKNLDLSGNVTVAGTVGQVTYTGKQIFTGNATSTAAKFVNMTEKISVLGETLTGTANVDISTQSIVYYTSYAANNWTINFRLNANTTLNSALGIGETISTVFMATNGPTAYYANVIKVDGVTVVPKWQNGTSITSGNPSSIDSYGFTIIKTSDATFTVLGSQVNYA